MANGDIPEAARVAGSLAGTVLSLVFIPPHSRSEFVSRAAASAIVGYIFGIYAIPYLPVGKDLSASDTALAATCMVSFAAWWLLGYFLKYVRARAQKAAESAE